MLPIKQDLGLPVKFIGVGEQVDDLQPFDAASFADALFDTERDDDRPILEQDAGVEPKPWEEEQPLSETEEEAAAFETAEEEEQVGLEPEAEEPGRAAAEEEVRPEKKKKAFLALWTEKGRKRGGIGMKFVIATHNQGKIVEFRRMLEPMGIEVVMAELSEPEETGKTFGENAYIKAESACRETGLPAVADDSGLCVDYLDGAPGIYSARFAEPGKRRLTVLEKLHGVPEEQRGAHFVSAVCCVFPNGDRIDAEGKCFGAIAQESRGENGFGYDSIFVQDGRTFGEMSDQEKDARSHRGKAFEEFERKLKEYLEGLEKENV